MLNTNGVLITYMHMYTQHVNVRVHMRPLMLMLVYTRFACVSSVCPYQFSVGIMTPFCFLPGLCFTHACMCMLASLCHGFIGVQPGWEAGGVFACYQMSLQTEAPIVCCLWTIICLGAIWFIMSTHTWQTECWVGKVHPWTPLLAHLLVGFLAPFFQHQQGKIQSVVHVTG